MLPEKYLITTKFLTSFLDPFLAWHCKGGIGHCELAQRQAVLLRKDKSPDRAIKSDRAKVVMTTGCILRIFDIQNYIYNPRETGNSVNQNLCMKKEHTNLINIVCSQFLNTINF